MALFHICKGIDLTERKAQVFIDGADKGVFNLFAKQPQFQVSIGFGNLGPGTHTIEIHPLHQKVKKSKGYPVVVDAFRGPSGALE